MYFYQMKIIWSKIASNDNLENIDYLLKEWNLSVVLAYEKKVIALEKILLSNPKLGSYDKDLQLYKILIVPQIYMFYELTKEEIQVIRIWNNYKKPYW